MTFDWDDANIEHIAAHQISPEEAEEALSDPFRIPAYRVGGERRRAVLGSTEDGRLLFVVTTRRGNGIRVITARDATTSERRRYRERGK
jgi:uncharacterized DUF497 family protein